MEESNLLSRLDVLNKRRSCTDLWMLILFLIYFVSWFATAIYAFVVVDGKITIISGGLDSSTIFPLVFSIILVGFFSFADLWLLPMQSKYTTWCFYISFFLYLLLIIAFAIINIFPTFVAQMIVTLISTYLLLFILLRKEWFQLSQRIFEEVLRVIKKSKALIFFMLVINALAISMAIFGAVVHVYVVHIPNVSMNVMKFLIVMTNLGTLWFSITIYAFGLAVFVGTMASSFWQGQSDKIAVLRCIQIVARYHFGTVAYTTSIFGFLMNLWISLCYVIRRVRTGTFSLAILGMIIYNIFDPILFKYWSLCGLTTCIAKGKGFYSGAKQSFEYFMEKPRRCLLVSKVSELAILVVSMSMIGFVSIFVKLYYIVRTGTVPDVHHPIFFVSMGLGFLFFLVPLITMLYAGMHAVLVCFLEDSMLHDGSEAKPYSMHVDLRAALVPDKPPQYFQKMCCAAESHDDD